MYLVGAGDVEYIDNVGGCGAEHKGSAGGSVAEYIHIFCRRQLDT